MALLHRGAGSSGAHLHVGVSVCVRVREHNHCVREYQPFNYKLQVNRALCSVAFMAGVFIETCGHVCAQLFLKVFNGNCDSKSTREQEWDVCLLERTTNRSQITKRWLLGARRWALLDLFRFHKKPNGLAVSHPVLRWSVLWLGVAGLAVLRGGGGGVTGEGAELREGWVEVRLEVRGQTEDMVDAVVLLRLVTACDSWLDI